MGLCEVVAPVEERSAPATSLKLPNEVRRKDSRCDKLSCSLGGVVVASVRRSSEPRRVKRRVPQVELPKRGSSGGVLKQQVVLSAEVSFGVLLTVSSRVVSRDLGSSASRTRSSKFPKQDRRVRAFG